MTQVRTRLLKWVELVRPTDETADREDKTQVRRTGKKKKMGYNKKNQGQGKRKRQERMEMVETSPQHLRHKIETTNTRDLDAKDYAE